MSQPTFSPSPSSSSLTERSAAAAELTPLIREIKAVCDNCDQPTFDSQRFHTAAESLLRLRHFFIDNEHPREAKEAFRHLDGFETLLQLARKLSELYEPADQLDEQRRALLVLYKNVLAVLAESLKGNFGNKRYFAKRVPGGGPALLQEALSMMTSKLDNIPGDTEQFYGGILAAALCQEVVADIFATINSKLQSIIELSLEDVRAEVNRHMGNEETIEVPELLGPLINAWLTQSASSSSNLRIQQVVLPGCLCQLASQSRRNLTAMHATGILSNIMPILFSNDRPELERALYQELAQLLCAQGLPDLGDAVTLYREAHSCTRMLRFLVDVLKCSREPPSIQFDMSLHGYSSLEFSSLGRPFPPITSSGYTLAVWARFDKFDPSTHTTIFGAFDASQTCFLLAYLEKDTRNFILQTSIKGTRPSVRFKSITFEPDRWYHICIVHKKPRPPTHSRASLFINGEFVEQLRIDYPCMPVSNTPNRLPRIQAFFGTPQDLATRLGKAVSTSRWSLANAILLEDAYSDDMVAVFYNLGPRYFGNFQDCLGSFQTYKASATLNLRNEHLHPGKEDASDIITAIRQKASALVREGSILINVSPMSVLDDDDSNNIDESQLVKNLSRKAAKNLHQLTKAGGNAVAANGAVPAINDALTQSHGVGILTGDPVISIPHSLDDASWRIGGCAAVHLSLVHAVKTPECLLLAVEALYEAVQDNWRNSEAMERENGYGVLASILRDKVGLGNASALSRVSSVCSNAEERSTLALQLLRLTLGFVGYDFEHPNQSIITNPLAYRVLLVDLDIWRLGEMSLLDLYYSQFCIFAGQSNFRRFNAKRLSRMRVNKKLLEALKGEELTPEALRLFISAFKSLMESCFSADLFRSLALFITYALHTHRGTSRLQRKKSSLSMGNADQPMVPIAGRDFVPNTKVAVEMLRMYCSILCDSHDFVFLRKFAKAVTNKWLLYLISEDEPEIVVLATKILARLIVSHGDVYNRKFADKTGGYVIMRHRLRKWWNIPAIWSICFNVLFGLDVGKTELEKPFDRSSLLESLSSKGEPQIIFPEMLPVLMEMMQAGLQRTVSADRIQLAATESSGDSQVQSDKPPTSSYKPVTDVKGQTSLLTAVVGLLAELHTISAKFRDFATQSDYIQGLIYSIFPVVVGLETSSADLEPNSRDSASSLHDRKFPIRPRSSGRTELRTTTVEGPRSRDGHGGSLRRGSSFILVSSDKAAKPSPSSACVRRAFIAAGPVPNMTATEHPLVQGILHLVLSVFSDQLLERKEFSGLGLYLKTPSSPLEHQAYFNSWILGTLLSALQRVTTSRPQLLLEPRALSNLGRFATHIGEAVFEGWFVGGTACTLEFAGTILEYLQQSDISILKSVRLCSQAVANIRSTLFRVVLLELSEIEDDKACAFLNRLSYWQVVLLSGGEAHSDYLQLLCYLLYTKLISKNQDIRLAAASLWRVILVQKPAEMSAILSHAAIPLQKRLIGGFEALVGMEDNAFIQWVDDHEEDLNALFFGLLSRSWETFTLEETTNIDISARGRSTKRQEKLKQWKQAEKLSDEVMRKHEATFPHWISNISASEFLKYQRALQDQQDNSIFMWNAFSRLTMSLKRLGGVLAEHRESRWRLDQTEGRSRMRLRIVPDDSGERQNYQPKRKASEPPAIKIGTQVQSSANSASMGLTPTALAAETGEDNPQDTSSDDRSILEESFEMIDDPKAGLEDYEDKNRKVMRSLHRGDQVESVCNLSRIIGLEACEGLLILGKDHIYILDNFFQRSDGEIVNVWQAPTEERDPYVRMIAGRESFERKTQEHETRSWKWSDLISVSKRRFLFRDVALEIFFTDGSSYLLTLISSRTRDTLCSQLATKAPQVTGSVGHSRPEDIWRFETLRSQEDAPQSLGSKFASVFGHSPVHPATRKWMKGEISNFHYLMLINTLAGRTFNDLTQYPIFPWVLADYTSEELDLTDPKTFRDLSKPMGCQNPEREAEFRERYKAFAEMGDDDSPPFHYGTHYSSAMIVCSYLIRLQPFVKSYLLLQGGTFDHADRLFYSIGKAWESASRGNMSDVRELTPEFFYLPEFLVNSNKYDFGLLQNMTTAIDAVELPPWAKGDPKIFIAKHREAVESPYVTENLHHWIDLVFGCKQKGEAAIEAVNVFHHLSYQGAKDLDAIDDPVERLATIGIIHNFGQTPHQIFTRPHPQREDPRHRVPRLDRLAESLTQLPLSLLDIDIGEQVSTLSMKQDRLLCAAPLRLNIPPNYDKYLEWGFFDGSVRFYSSGSRKLLGHFEHLHVGQLSCTIFADSRTLVTSGTDCVVSIWTFTSTGKSVDLIPAGSLFGHRTAVTVLAVSRSFSALLSASMDGQIILWDLNQQCFVRELPAGGPVDCACINDVTGEIVVCRGSRLSLYTLNGALLLEQDVCESLDDHVMSCVFYEGVDNEWQERELIFTGHRRGVVNIWSKIIRNGRFELELIRQLHHIDNNRDNGANISVGISCILTLPHVVYTGDEAGRVYEWSCVQRR
ncbi:Beige/BEACH domain protein [Aspergillus clavatus NRRL 1]|uniref:Beige/BEACH domain protein n=1 Tax=Aspergillus clavatus (strain ATCC 1007 / CBS 513.65 / DSM 816 / NCTC 3887 / NRRL 1 / QM 1276 / 107) TaxID=344612 RepID=A1CAE0_ASPCL|nr:Beige/BEACH domain protein [Aspergillus clavatus NRRL 1]EAW12708.1 Beige/BEACH domain protein [Aspergillus clavatus NRRL 1]